VTIDWFPVRYAARHPWLRSLLWLNAAIALSLLPLLAVWAYTAREHDRLDSAIDATRRQLVDKQQGGRLSRVVRESGVLVPAFEKKLQNASGQAQIIDQFLKLARRHGVRLNGTSFDTRPARDRYQPVLIELRLQGTYPALRNLFREMQTLPLWAEIQELSMEPERDGGGLRARVRVLSYRPAGESRS
jgi:hypothetical protein